MTPVERAIFRSKEKADIYLADHLAPWENINAGVVTRLATARLQQILEKGRSSLSDIFSKDEITELHSFFYGQVFYPAAIEDIAGSYMDYLDMEHDETGSIEDEIYDDKAVERQVLLRKLVNLNALQRLALTDFFEFTWARQSNPHELNALLAQCGVRLVG